VHVGLADEQRGLERALLDRRQFRQDLRGCIAQEIGQPAEREAGLGFRGSAGNDPITPGGRRVDAGQPQRRLADAGLTM